MQHLVRSITDSNCPIIFYPTLPNHDVGRIELEGWEESYEVADEPVPSNAPEPRGQPMKMTCLVDASHASNKVTYRSHTGIFICQITHPWCGTRSDKIL